MKKGIFITTPKMDDKFYFLEKNEFGRLHNTRENDIASQGGLLTVMKQFNTKDNIKSAVLRITSLGNFEALVNGRRVGRDGVFDELAPLWTDYRHRVFEYQYDILPYLKSKGKNTFAARVSSGWWSGRISVNYYGYKKTAICAEIEITYNDGTVKIIATDESWNTAVAGPVLYADIWNGELFDATIPDPCVYPKSIDWTPAEKFTDYTCEITDFEGEYVRVNEYIAPKSAIVYSGIKNNNTDFGEINVIKKATGDNCERFTLKSGQTLLLDFGNNIVGRPALAIKALDGTNVKCLFAEMLNDSGDKERGNDGPKGSLYIANYRSALSRFNYVAASGKMRRRLNIIKPIHTFYGFRYMELTADKDIVVECITAEVLTSNLKPLGSFECSDSKVNKLYQNIVRGMKGNYIGVPTDCPQRDERYGWTGDTQVFCGAASYIADTYKFLSKYLGDMRDSQKQRDGAYADICPAVFEKGFCGTAAWGDAGIIIPYKLWLMYGDDTVVHKNYDAMEAYMNYIDKKHGLDGAHAGYGDWLSYEATDKWYVSICYHYNNAVLMQKFSKHLGKTDREEYYKALAQKILHHYFDKYVVNGEITETSQTAYLLPLAFDMFEGEMRDKTIKNLENKIIQNNCTLSTGFVGTGVICQTLAKVGLNDLAYSLLLQEADPSWLYSINQGATTIWERWNSYTLKNGFGDVGMNSFNHYAYGAVAEWMFSSMAGIKPDPEIKGFDKHFILSPIPDTQKRITSAKAKYRDILSEWKYKDGELIYHFIIPNGSASVEIPFAQSRKSVEINGTVYKAEDLRANITDGKIIFELVAGEYVVK
ncbi:MAG: family 78 glycoside hydrolase catalytic domain [Clostridia bacterium]|nr:family 78 glycoside hydrolase catalytic domain [Clostridia bacterium]